MSSARTGGVPDGLVAVLPGDGPGTGAALHQHPLDLSNEVHVNDGYTRHGGEGQFAAFTRRQWIGIQTTAVS